MKISKKTAAERPLDEVKERRLVAMHLQHIEDNPLTVEEIAIFEMFESENWSHDRRLAYIRKRSTASFFNPAAE